MNQIKYFFLLLCFPLVCLSQEEIEDTCDMKLLDQTLKAEKKFVSVERVGSLEYDKIMSEYFSLTGNAKSCASKIVSEQTEIFLEHCNKLGCFKNIGGGCFHMGKPSLGLYNHAFKVCSKKP